MQSHASMQQRKLINIHKHIHIVQYKYVCVGVCGENWVYIYQCVNFSSAEHALIRAYLIVLIYAFVY